LIDIAVIGGGPVGSRVAFNLAKKGYQVEVFEKRVDIGGKPCCTGIISQECISRYNIPLEVIYRPVNSAKIFSPSGKFFRIYRQDAQASIVNRRAFDYLLAKRAKDQGAKYSLACAAEKIIALSDKVIIECAQQGNTRQIEAKAAVLATGFNALLPKNLGFQPPNYFTTGVQAEVETRNIDEVEVYLNQNTAPGFFAWLVPISANKSLAGLMTRQSPGWHLRNWINTLASAGKVTQPELAIRYSGIPLKPIKRTFGNRLLIVGDAAGQVKPTTGGGIYFGLICADIAADTLHNALNYGDLTSRMLARYEKEWRKILAKELQQGLFTRRLYERLNNQQIELIHSTCTLSGIVESIIKEPDLSFDWHSGLMLKMLKLAITSRANRILTAPLNILHK
jgi:digeranylgeranylglycerophospholipid reductase